MDQLELPLEYESYRPIVRPAKNSPDYQLPLRWKAVFVLLLIYGVTVSGFQIVKASRTQKDDGQVKGTAVEAITEKQTTNGSAQVKMTASVAGWYGVEKMDETNIMVMSNMKVWVNGREFVRCEATEQETVDPSLLDY